MHELDADGERHMAVAGVAAHSGGGERQHRAQPLAAGIDQMPGQLRDHADLGLRLLDDDTVDALHIGFDELDQRLDARLRIACLAQLNDNPQGTSSGVLWPWLKYSRRQCTGVKPDRRTGSVDATESCEHSCRLSQVPAAGPPGRSRQSRERANRESQGLAHSFVLRLSIRVMRGHRHVGDRMRECGSC